MLSARHSLCDCCCSCCRHLLWALYQSLQSHSSDWPSTYSRSTWQISHLLEKVWLLLFCKRRMSSFIHVGPVSACFSHRFVIYQWAWSITYTYFFCNLQFRMKYYAIIGIPIQSRHAYIQLKLMRCWFFNPAGGESSAIKNIPCDNQRIYQKATGNSYEGKVSRTLLDLNKLLQPLQTIGLTVSKRSSG